MFQVQRQQPYPQFHPCVSDAVLLLHSLLARRMHTCSSPHILLLFCSYMRIWLWEPRCSRSFASQGTSRSRRRKAIAFQHWFGAILHYLSSNHDWPDCGYPKHCLTSLGMQTDRRAALAGLAAVPALLVAKPSNAAYGEGANVFGKTTNTSGAPRLTAALQCRPLIRPTPRFCCEAKAKLFVCAPSQISWQCTFDA
jgi:hypothetical protein